MKNFFALLLFLSGFGIAFSQTTYTWNGSISSNWSVPGNWTPAGPPGNLDHVVVVAAPNAPTLVANTTITNLTVTSGTLDLGGFTLNASGNHTFTAGTVTNGNLSTTASGNSTFTNTTFTASATVNIVGNAITINGGIFNGTTSLRVAGTGNTTGTGNATFNGNTLLHNSGTGYFRTNGNMTFNGPTELRVSGSNYLLLELTTGNTYNGPLTLTLTPTATDQLRMGYLGTTNYNNSITVNNQSNSNIRFGEQATAINNLNAGNTISAGTCTSGYVILNNFRQLGATTQNITLTGTASFQVTNSIFNAALNVSAPNFYVTSSTFNGNTSLTKTDGTSTNNSGGGNTFNGTLTLNYFSSVGTGYLGFGLGSPDIFNGDVFTNNNSLDRIILCHNSVGNQFNGNVTVTQIGSSVGTALTWGPGTVTLAATKSIFIGGAGYSTGYLYVQGLTQSGSQPISLAQTGNASIQLGPNSLFGGVVTITSPSIYARGATYSDDAIFTKTGTTNDHNNGAQNIFNGDLQINQQGTGYFMLGYNSNDLFNGDITLTSTNTGGINLGWTGGTGTPTLASGKTIFIGGAGFSQGYLSLSGFTQLGSAAINLDMDGADFYVRNVPAPSSFGGDLTVKATNIRIEGGVFNGITTFTKTGSVDNHNSQQQNIFNAALNINQQGTGYFMLGYNSNDLFNGNITVTSTNTGNIHLGWTSGTGTPTMAAGNTIFIGGAGYNAGHLYFGGFTQLGNVPVNLSLGNAARISFRDSNIGGNLVAQSGRVFTNGTTFNGTVLLEKTGSLDDASSGGNHFSANTELKNSGDGYFLMGNGSPDIFDADLVMNNTGGYRMYLAYNSAGNSIGGNLTVNNTGAGLVDNNIYFLNTVSSTMTIGGNLVINNQSTAPTANIQFSNDGNTTVNGSTTVLNAQAGTTKRVWLGVNGSMIFNGLLTLNNTSSATNSEIFLSYGSASSNMYNQNIIVSSSDPSCAGIRFGEGGGSGILAATKTITIGGGGFIAGRLYFRNFTQIGNTPQTLLATGTSRFENLNSNWGGNVQFSGGRMLTNGTTYQGTAYLEKLGATDDASAGGNHFFGDTELRNSGTGYFLMGNGAADVWDQDLLMTNSGQYRMYLAHASAGNSVGGDLTINNTGTGLIDNNIYLVNSVTSTLSVGGDLTINNLSAATGATISFSESGASTIAGNAILNNNATGAGATIYLGNAGGVTLSGNLTANNIGSALTSRIYIASGAASAVSVGGTAVLNNNNTGTTGEIYLANAAGSSVSIAGVATLTNAGALTTKRSWLGVGGNVQFANTLTLNNSASATNSEVFLNYNPTSTNQYNGNIVVTNSNASGGGVRFGQNGGAGTLAATKTITIGGAGFVAGQLLFRNFTQVGPTPQTLMTTGTTHFENYNSNWGGNVIFTGARMFTRGTTYQGTSYLEKFGGIGNDASAGGNTFVGNCELRNSGSLYFLMGNGAPDVWSGNLLVNNTGTNLMYLAYNSSGNTIAGNLTVNNTGSGADNSIQFVSTTTSTLDITGNVILNNLITGAAANISFPEGGLCSVGGTLTATNNGSGANSQILLANGSVSGLTVGGATTITNSGAGTTKRTYLGNQGDITFNGTLAILNNSTATNSEVFCNFNPTSTNFYNQSIVLQNTDNLSDGIFFGNSGGFGTLAASKTVTIGGGGFIAGTLFFRNFTQLSTTAQAITLTGTTTIFENYNSSWYGDVTFVSPRLFSRGTLYDRTSLLHKNGANNDASVGGNTFNGNTRFLNSGTGYLMLSNTTGNDHNANVTYEKTNTGLLYPTYNATSTYAGDITINSNSVVTFGDAGNGRVLFDGTGAQSVNNTGSASMHIMRRITTNKSGGAVTLNTPIVVSNDLTLSAGNINTSAVNLLIMNAGSAVSAVSDAAYVSGPLRKIGNTAFTFPIGKDGFYRPASIGAPSNAAHHFTAEYFFTDPVNNGLADNPVESPLVQISNCEYWIIDRTNGSSNVTVTLSYRTVGVNGCSGVVDPAQLRVARWDGTMWRNHGNGGTTGVASNGTIISAAALTSFSPITLATIDFINPLPIELIAFNAVPKINQVELTWTTKSESGNDYFVVERSLDGEHFEAVLQEDGAGNSSEELDYRRYDEHPVNGLSYYRLKQVDFDGAYSYSAVRTVYFEGAAMTVYPNPVQSGQTIYFNTDSALDEPLRIMVYDAAGKCVFDDVTTTRSTDLNLSAGTYFVNISNAGFNRTERLMIQN